MAKPMMNEMEKNARQMRDQAVATAMRRKEEYLGARVPRELRDRVIERARELGIPVSILIRNVLEEAFRDPARVPGGVMMPSSQVSPASADRFAHVLGWERIVLNRPVRCAGCGRQLETGMEVTLGLGGGEHVILCPACKMDRI